MNAAIRILMYKRQAGRLSYYGFTLIELLLAATVSAVLASVLYGVFANALKLRERGQEAADRNSPTIAAMEILRRDLKGVTSSPRGVFAGPILGEAGAQTNSRADSLSFYTTTGSVTDNAPWGDIQQVTYCLADTQSGDASAGRDLVRQVTRNILPTSNPTEPEEQRLLDGVQSLHFEYLISNGGLWVDSWDSANDTETTLSAIRAHVDFVANADKKPSRRSIELVSEVATKDYSTTTSQTQ